VTPLDVIKRRLVGPVVAWLDRYIDLYYIANGALRREIALRAPGCRGRTSAPRASKAWRCL